ncbi:MAG: hypothetical protein HY705_01385, partial [Gemmatimonadetes bacterium]|nr:hypothetical protein [Gemmatimonadota bacterium]
MSPRLAFVAPPARESDAVWSWLRERRELGPQRYDPRDLRAALRDADVIWLHAASPLPELPLERLHAFVTGGGGLLLTLRAAELVGPMGLEAAPPNDVADARWSHESDELYEAGFHGTPSHPHVRGIACYGPHPLVAGLHHGTYTWAPSEGEPYARACYKNGERPADGRVVGVERAYLSQNPDRVVAWEYAAGRGRVVCVGAFVYFAAPDGLQRPQLERLILNAVEATVSRAEGGDRTYWPQPGSFAAPSEALVLPAPLDFEGALPDPDEDPIVLAGHVEADEPFDLAGRRLLLVGRERLGIAEIWIHPHRVVS